MELGCVVLASCNASRALSNRAVGRRLDEEIATPRLFDQLRGGHISGSMDLFARHAASVFRRPVPEEARSAWLGHIPFARWVIAAHKPTRFVELGTHTGASYLAFCQAVVDDALRTECTAIDTWLGDEHAGEYGDDIYREFRNRNARYSTFSRALRMTFDEALAEFPDGSVDLLHIDGLHTYAASKHDFESWLPKLSNRALVLFHDIAEKKSDFGVWRLWQELERNYPSFAFTHEHGLGVLGVGRNLPVDVVRLFELDANAAAEFRRAFEVVGVPISESAERKRRNDVYERKVDEAKGLRDAERRAKDSAVAKVADLQASNQVLANTIAQLTVEKSKIESDRQELALINANVEERNRKSAEYVAFLESKGDHLESENREFEEKVQWLRGKVETTTKTVGQLSRRNRQLAAELAALRQSRTWRTGSAVLAPFRMLRKLRTLGRLAVAFTQISLGGGFDAPWYARRYRGGRGRKAANLWHYVRFGHRQGWDPAPDFSTKHYVRVHAEQMPAGVNPLAHYLTRGAAMGWSPKPGFDARDRRGEDALRRRLTRQSRRGGPRGLEFDFTVLMPFFNEAAVMATAIESVRAQKYPRWNLILIDDGSDDGSSDIAANFAAQDDRIQVITGDHGGASKARNLGIAAAAGSHIAYLDADNFWEPDFLLLVSSFLAESGATSIYSGQIVKNDEGEQIGYRGRPFDWEACAQSNHVDLNCFVHSTELVRERGGFDETLKRYVDWDLVLRLTHEQPVGFLALPLSVYFEHGGLNRISKRHFSAYRSIVVAKQESVRARQYRASAVAVKLDIAIKVAAPSAKKLAWGDYHFARSLADSLQAFGHRVRVDCGEFWESKPAQVVIVIRGLREYQKQSGELVVLWSISHPDQLSFEEIDSADLFYVASDSTKALFESATMTAPKTLLQATDSTKFHSGAGMQERSGFAFVGNTRKVFREVVRWAVELKLPLRLIGQGWRDYVPRSAIEAELVANDRLPQVYGSAEVVLNDHWESMREYGYISNRVFDAVACGAMVISDDIPTIGRVFGGMVKTASTLEEFAAAAHELDSVTDAERTAASANITNAHSFYARARFILRDVYALLGMPEMASEPAGDLVPQFGGLLGAARPIVTALARHGVSYPTSSAYIRLVSPFTTESAIDKVDFRLARAADWSNAAVGDVVLVQRTALDSLGDAQKLVDVVRARGAKLLVDTDDDFLSIRDGHPQQELYEPLVDAHTFLVREADQNWFSTERLDDAYRAFTPSRRVLRNSIDQRVWRNYREPVLANPDPEQALRVLYMGTRTHRADLEMVLPALDMVHNARPGGIQLTLVGIGDDLPDRPYFDVVGPGTKNSAYPRFARWLRGQGPFDVGIAPLQDTPFNRGKSDLKLLEYGALGIAPLYSRVGDYADTADSTDLGMPVSNIASVWYDALVRLIDDREAARRMGAEARQYAFENRSVAKTSRSIVELINELV